MLFVIVYTLIEYLNIYLAYRIILNATFQKKKWIYATTLSVICILQIILKKSMEYDCKDFLIAGTGFFIIAIWAEKKKLKNVLLFPIVYIGTSVVNTLGSYLYSIIMHTTEFDVINTPIKTLISECTAIIIIIYIGHWRKKKGAVQKEHTLNVKQYIILLVGLLNFVVVMGVAQAWEYKDHISLGERNAFGLAEVVVAFLFIVLNIWQQITLRNEQEYRKKNEVYENYIQLQEGHIRMLIDKDEDMRRFRHDFHAHMTALKAYAIKIQDTEIQKYINDMQEKSGVYSVQKYTGIAAVDAVISELIYPIEEQKIEIKWEGSVNFCDKIDIFDLCTIFFNLLSNAIEACEKQSYEKSEIYVKTYCYEGKIYIDIKNSISEYMDDKKEQRLETTKEDKKNHGFGIQNVKDTVKKYEGSFECWIKSGWFEVEILI